MLIARFQFRPESAHHFCEGRFQTIVEVPYDDIRELISFCQEVERHLIDCTVYTGEEIISLKSLSV